MFNGRLVSNSMESKHFLDAHQPLINSKLERTSMFFTKIMHLSHQTSTLKWFILISFSDACEMAFLWFSFCLTHWTFTFLPSNISHFTFTFTSSTLFLLLLILLHFLLLFFIFFCLSSSSPSSFSSSFSSSSLSSVILLTLNFSIFAWCFYMFFTQFNLFVFNLLCWL